MNRNLYLLFLLILFSSCEGIIRGKGKIISASHKSPIDSVKFNWQSEVIYSDKNGDFSFDKFGGCVPSCPDLELLLTKPGYKPTYINLTKENEEGRSIFELTPANEENINLTHYNSKTFFYYVSIVTAIISLITLIALAGIKIDNKAIWFMFILLGTVRIQYNYLAQFTEFGLFRPALFIFFRWTSEPTWYQVNLPIGLLVFLIFYFYRIKKKKNASNNQ